MFFDIDVYKQHTETIFDQMASNATCFGVEDNRTAIVILDQGCTVLRVCCDERFDDDTLTVLLSSTPRAPTRVIVRLGAWNEETHKIHFCSVRVAC